MEHKGGESMSESDKKIVVEEKKAPTAEEIKRKQDRERNKLAKQLKTMQYMWIPMSRMSDTEIEALNNKENEEELIRQWKMHSVLWAEYDHKPTAPKLCISCGKEVGKYEYKMTDENGETVLYNDECRECLTGDDWYGS